MKKNHLYVNCEINKEYMYCQHVVYRRVGILFTLYTSNKANYSSVPCTFLSELFLYLL